MYMCIIIIHLSAVCADHVLVIAPSKAISLLIADASDHLCIHVHDEYYYVAIYCECVKGYRDSCFGTLALSPPFQCYTYESTGMDRI